MEAQCDTAMLAVENIPATMRERLQKKKEQLERNIAEIDSTLKLMDENPGFEKVHDAISRLGFLGLR